MVTIEDALRAELATTITERNQFYGLLVILVNAMRKCQCCMVAATRIDGSDLMWCDAHGEHCEEDLPYAKALRAALAAIATE